MAKSKWQEIFGSSPTFNSKLVDGRRSLYWWRPEINIDAMAQMFEDAIKLHNLTAEVKIVRAKVVNTYRGSVVDWGVRVYIKDVTPFYVGDKVKN